MRFYPGLHQPSDAKRFDRAFISVNRIRGRKKPIGAGAWIMDSGSFTEIATYGYYRHSVLEHAAEINRWAHDRTLVAAVAQDYMCEPFILQKTGLTVAEHQRLTIERQFKASPQCFYANTPDMRSGCLGTLDWAKQWCEAKTGNRPN